MIGPSGCGKSTFLRCLNRMNDLVPGVRVGGQVLYHGIDLYGSDADPVEVRRRIGMVFQRAESLPEVDLRQHRVRTEEARSSWRHRRARREVATRGRPMGRSQGPPQAKCPRSVRRAAATPLHRARDRRRARRRAAGRAGVRARPDLHLGDRRSDARAEDRLHARDRHAQHAAGSPRGRPDSVLQPRPSRRRDRNGILVEYDATDKIFTSPTDERTEGYVTGRFG